MTKTEQRIKRAYWQLTGYRDGRHVAWFADVAHVTTWTVQRWLSGRRRFTGPAVAVLEQLEMRANCTCDVDRVCGA
jgi:hypothetical protein